MRFVSYHVEHVDLAGWDPVPASDSGRGLYIVFWWHDIPLGELYCLPADKTMTPATVYEAILPTLKHYEANYGISRPSSRIIHTYDELRMIVNGILKNRQRLRIPKKCSLSVVICTRNRASLLRKCITHLRKQHCVPAEIIVVDNAPQDHSTENVVSEFREIRYIREDKPGLDVARNTGARHTTQPFVAYTDDDATPHPLWTYHIWESFMDQSVMAMTGLVLAAELNTEAQLIFEKHWPFNRGYKDKVYDTLFFESKLRTGIPAWEIGAGANMAFRREVFEKLGYFDERLDVGAAGCSGDSELWYRILGHGYTIHYNPRAVVHHLHRESIDGLRKQLYSYMRGFTVAILVQYQRFKNGGELRHLFLHIPGYYFRLLLRGFPHYSFRNRTLWSEIRGLISGLIYYWKHRNSASNIFIANDKR